MDMLAKVKLMGIAAQITEGAVGRHSLDAHVEVTANVYRQLLDVVYEAKTTAGQTAGTGNQAACGE